MLSDVVGARVGAVRRRKGLTREALAALVTDCGWELSTDVLTNIETRRSKGRAGSREVTVDELSALARALDVPPIVLLFPMGIEPVVSMPWGDELTWSAARWFMGRTDMEGLSVEDEPDAAPVALHERHQHLVDEYDSLIGRANIALILADENPGSAERLRTEADEALSAAESALAALVDTRREMRRLGLPALPVDIHEPLRQRLNTAEA